MTISEPSLHAEPCTQTALRFSAARGALARLSRLERVQSAAQGRAVAARRERARQRDGASTWRRPSGGGWGARLVLGLGLLHQACAVRVVARASLATRAALLRPAATAAAAAAAAAAKAHQREARRRLGARGWRTAEVATVRARGER